MTKNLKKFKVNAVININFPVYVVAEDEDEAISKCEESISESNLDIYADSIGLSLPGDCFEDDDCTDVFYSEYHTIEPWGDFEFSVDEYEEPEDIKLEYTEDEEDD